MSMNIHSVLQQFATLSPYHAFGDVTDHIACIHLASEDSPIATLQHSDYINLTETEFGTFYAQVRGHDPIRLETRVVALRVGDRRVNVHIPSKLTHAGQRIIQERQISKDVAEQLFGSSNSEDDAVVKRTLFKISLDEPVQVEAEIHPAHHTINEVAKQIDEIIKKQFDEIAKDELEGLYAARKYFAGSNELVCNTVNAAIQYVKADPETTDFALWAFKYGAKDETNRLLAFLNTATVDEQKQFWAQDSAQTEKLLSLLAKYGSQIQQLHFPRLDSEVNFFEPRPDGFIAKAIALCPNLQKISLCFCDTDHNVLVNCSKLVELNAEEDSITLASLPTAPNLRRLKCKLSNPFQSFELARKYPRLESLTVNDQVLK